MPANHYIDKEARLIVTTWEGEASDLEFMESLKKYQEEIQNHPDNINYNEVLDLSDMAGIKLTTEGLKSIGLIASRSDCRDIRRKLAIIVSSNFAYGLARMYEIYRGFSNKSNKEVNIFKNREEAYAWVKKHNPTSR